jgi:hypothetical protein
VDWYSERPVGLRLPTGDRQEYNDELRIEIVVSGWRGLSWKLGASWEARSVQTLHRTDVVHTGRDEEIVNILSRCGTIRNSGCVARKAGPPADANKFASTGSGQSDSRTARRARPWPKSWRLGNRSCPTQGLDVQGLRQIDFLQQTMAEAPDVRGLQRDPARTLCFTLLSRSSPSCSWGATEGCPRQLRQKMRLDTLINLADYLWTP